MKNFKLILGIIIVLILISGIFYFVATDFDRNYDKYKVRYSKQECLESPYCPEEFKEMYRNPEETTSKDLIGVLNGDE